MTYPRTNIVKQTRKDQRMDQKMKMKCIKKISKKAFKNNLVEVKCQDENMEEADKTIAVSVKMLEEQLAKGIRITKLQRELHQIINEFKIKSLKAIIPLHKQYFERDFNTASKKIEEIENYVRNWNTNAVIGKKSSSNIKLQTTPL